MMAKYVRINFLLVVLAVLALPVCAEDGLKVKLSADSVGRYEKLEIDIDGVGSIDVPGNPKVVMVDAHLVSPSGKKLVVPGFATHEIKKERQGRNVKYAVVGDWVWKVRFAAQEVGTYKGKIVVTAGAEKKEGAKFKFKVAASKSKGMIRVAKGNPYAFEYEDGTPYIIIGHNLCWNNAPDRAGLYRSWLDKMAASGCNFIRIWLGAGWCFGIEKYDRQTDAKAYVYNEDPAALMDEVLELCEQRGIAVKLCFGSQIDNYFESKGGPYAISNAGQFLRKEESKTQWKALERYAVARWGYSTSIMAWEMWNEMDDNFWQVAKAKDIAEWTEEMCAYLKSIDPYQHLTVNSTGSAKKRHVIWSRPSVDFAQYHNYGGARYKDKTQYEIYAADLKELRRSGKPVLLAECGLVDDKWGPYSATSGNRRNQSGPKDMKGYAFHEGIWVGFMAGGAGTGLHWWWDSMIDPWDLYYHYKPFVKFVSDIPLNKAPLPPVDATVTPGNLQVYARSGSWGTIALVVNRDANWRAIVEQNKKIEPLSGAKVMLPVAGKGVYKATFMDTFAGRILGEKTANVDGNSLELGLPTFRIDVAVKIAKVESQK